VPNVLRVRIPPFPARKFTAEHLRRAFAAGGVTDFRTPGRKQTMDSHEVQGLLQSYLHQMGGVIDPVDPTRLELPDRVRPVIDAMALIFYELFPERPRQTTAALFQIDTAPQKAA
jgi:hypothetical protein